VFVVIIIIVITRYYYYYYYYYYYHCYHLYGEIKILNRPWRILPLFCVVSVKYSEIYEQTLNSAVITRTCRSDVT